MSGLPTTPVHDLLIHARDNELIAGTHGRSIWIADITPLQQMTNEVRMAKAAFFTPRTGFQWGESTINGGNAGHGVFQAPSPQYGASLWYRLTEAAGGQVRIVIQNAAGDTLRTLTGPGQVGLHNVVWDFRGQGAPAPRSRSRQHSVRSSAQRVKRVLLLESRRRAGSNDRDAIGKQVSRQRRASDAWRRWFWWWRRSWRRGRRRGRRPSR
jgi:hypothetical protein